MTVSLQHDVERFLRELGPFEAQLIYKSGQIVHGEVTQIKRLWADDDIFVTIENTTIPGVRKMDVHVGWLESLLPCGHGPDSGGNRQ